MITHPVLEQLASAGVRLGLDRVRSLLVRLGEPQRAYPVVHVAGTNGKGSVCAMVSAALVEAGYRVGTYSSPHVEHLNERVRIDLDPIDDGSLREAIESLDRERWNVLDFLDTQGPPLTYFEFMTILAFQEFARQAVDVAVVEVGLGGRLDATNVVQPVVTAITHVGLDHVEVLGDDLATIAGEKAGILERGVPVILGPMPAAAQGAIEVRATALAAPVWKPGRDLMRGRHRDRWSFGTPLGSVNDVELAMPGEHQGGNASVAVGILHTLREAGFRMPDDAIRRGLARARMPGRIERLLPALVVDGCHNRDSAEALAAWLARQPRPGTRILLWGMGQDREPVSIIEPLIPHVDEVVTTRCAHPKAREPLDLAWALQDQLDVVLAAGGPIEQALPEVYREADETIVAGSLFVAGAARSLFAAGALDGIEPGQGPAEE